MEEKQQKELATAFLRAKEKARQQQGASTTEREQAEQLREGIHLVSSTT